MILLLATNNLHKKREFEALFAGWTLHLPGDLGLAGWDHDETADSFVGNALGKAQSLWRLSGGAHPVLADDSGICVDALGGAPGIYSARYGQAEAGRLLTDPERNELLLARLAGQTRRSARFVCALALVVAEHRVFVAEESWEGEVAPGLEGRHGFGYDPLFYLPDLGCTSAELEPARKNEISHRGRASRALRTLLPEVL